MSVVPLVYEEIKQDLLSRIGRQWPAGSRLPSAGDLARQLGTGQRNTLRAMQELVREGYLQSRPGRGTFVTRTPSRPQQGSSRQSRPQTAGRLLILLPPGWQDGFLLDIARAIEAAAVERGVKATFHLAGPKYDLTQPPYAEFDALAILNPDERRIRLTPQQKVVVISTINRVHVDAIGGFDVVSIEEEHGGYLAGRLLRQAGHERACFLGVRHKATPTVTDPTSAVRLRGFEAGFGKPVAAEHLLWGTAYRDESGAVAMSKYLAMRDRPQAVFAASDELAIGFAIAGLAMGLRPGRDFDLVGFDGQHRGRDLAECPSLTSVAVPSLEMGRRATELLLGRLQRPDKPVERVLLACSIYRGGTLRRLDRPTDSEASS